ncbi:MAG: hypothetical protein JST54_18715 [Deltaproteobacteria bacterium]|nr:hypothetical protein [Deltaproteobacteria bacterium]
MSRSFSFIAAAALALATALSGCGQAACGPENCAGCCGADGICHTADNDNCGANGSVCETCPGLQTCEQGVCAFAGQGSNGNGTSGSGTTATSTTGSTAGTGNTTAETAVTSGSSGGTTGSGHHDQVICGDCVSNDDCESGFCDFLNQNGHHGFCDSAQPCASNDVCGNSQCDPTGGGYCLCPQLGSTTTTAASTGTAGTTGTSGTTSSTTAASTSTGGTTATTETGTVGSTSTGGTTSTTGETSGSTSSGTTTSGASTTTGTSSTSTSGTSGSSGTTGTADQCGVVMPVEASCTSTCTTGYTCTNGLCELDGADGPLEITLRWNSSDDLDLHLVGPNGCEVFYGNTNKPGFGSSCSAQGQLDLDSNAACSVTGSGPVENIIFPAGTVLDPGSYSVRVDLYETCGSTAAIPYEITVRNGSSTAVTCGSVLPSQADSGSAGSGVVATSFTL